MPRAIVLVDHGSRREEANAVVAQLALLVSEKSEPGTIVRHAHMELAPPTLDEAIDSCLEAGADSIVVVPYFLTPGRHASIDIPAMVAAASGRNPQVELRVAAPLGVHALLADLVLERSR